MKKRIFIMLLMIVLTITTVVANGSKEQETTDPSEVTIWFHGGTADETDAMRAQIERFNRSQSKYNVEMTEIPGGAVAGSGYNDSVNAAAVAGKLPDILDLDGPNLYNYAWAGFLLPLEDLVDSEIIADLLPSLIDQGTYNNHLFAIGQYDSGLSLGGRKSLLKKAGIRIPSGYNDAWSQSEFLDAMARLVELDEVKYAIDMKINYGAGEWFTYAFSPIFQGFGADLIDRNTFLTAEGVLNGSEGLAAMNFLKSLFTKGYANPAPIDDNDFVNGITALGVVGHWMTKSYQDAFGDDFILIPMPVWDKKSITGMGSWAWAISSQTKNKEGAVAFLEFMLQPEEILSITNINGAVPGREKAFSRVDAYKPNGVLNIFVQQLQQGGAVPRPATPGYPAITVAFYTAVDNVIKGADPQAELDTAVDKIDKDIAENDGYPQQ